MRADEASTSGDQYSHLLSAIETHSSVSVLPTFFGQEISICF
jgi:hypothetical protein